MKPGKIPELPMITVHVFALTVKLGTSGERREEIQDDFITELSSKRTVCVQLLRKALKRA